MGGGVAEGGGGAGGVSADKEGGVGAKGLVDDVELTLAGLKGGELGGGGVGVLAGQELVEGDAAGGAEDVERVLGEGGVAGDDGGGLDLHGGGAGLGKGDGQSDAGGLEAEASGEVGHGDAGLAGGHIELGGDGLGKHLFLGAGEQAVDAVDLVEVEGAGCGGGGGVGCGERCGGGGSGNAVEAAAGEQEGIAGGKEELDLAGGDRVEGGLAFGGDERLAEGGGVDGAGNLEDDAADAGLAAVVGDADELGVGGELLGFEAGVDGFGDAAQAIAGGGPLEGGAGGVGVGGGEEAGGIGSEEDEAAGDGEDAALANL